LLLRAGDSFIVLTPLRLPFKISIEQKRREGPTVARNSGKCGGVFIATNPAGCPESVNSTSTPRHILILVDFKFNKHSYNTCIWHTPSDANITLDVAYTAI
jgi:hypothetical protein